MGSPRSACIIMLARQSVAVACLLIVSAAVSVTAGGGAAGSNKMLNITNMCAHKVWPEIIFSGASSSSAAPDTTGFKLAPGQWKIVAVPPAWSGGILARTLGGSSSSSSTTTGSKQDCGGPVTVAEFAIDGSGGMDLYDVSLVDGFNLPVMVAPQPKPQGGGGDTMHAITFCPSKTRYVWERVLYAEKGGGGGIIGEGTATSPSLGNIPSHASAASKLTTADKVGVAFLCGVLTGVAGCYVCVTMYRRCLRHEPEEEVALDDEELARVSTTGNRGDSRGRSNDDDTLRSVIIHSSPTGDTDGSASPDEQHFPGSLDVVPR